MLFRLSSFFFFLSLLANATSVTGPFGLFDDKLPIYIIGDASGVADGFNFVGMIVNSTALKSIILFGIIVALYRIAMKLHSHSAEGSVAELIYIVFILFFFLTPSTSVAVQDARIYKGGAKQPDADSASTTGYISYQDIDNIPLGIAVIASFSTTIGWELAALVDTVIAPVTPDGEYLGLTKAGINQPSADIQWILQNIANGIAGEKGNKDYEYMLYEYVKTCALPTISLDITNSQKIVSPPDGDYKTYLSPDSLPVDGTSITHPTTHATMSCRAFWDNELSTLSAGFENDVFQQFREYKKFDAGYSDTNQENGLRFLINSQSTAAIANLKDTMSSLKRASIVAGAVNAASTGINGIDMSNQMAMTASKQNIMVQGPAQFAWLGEVLPLAINIGFGFLIVMSVLMAIFLLFHGWVKGLKVILNFAAGFFALSFSYVSLAITQGIVNRRAFADNFEHYSSQGSPLQVTNYSHLLEQAATMDGLTGLLGTVFVAAGTAIVFYGESKLVINGLLGKVAGSFGGNNLDQTSDDNAKDTALATSLADAEQRNRKAGKLTQAGIAFDGGNIETEYAKLQKELSDIGAARGSHIAITSGRNSEGAAENRTDLIAGAAVQSFEKSTSLQGFGSQALFEGGGNLDKSLGLVEAGAFAKGRSGAAATIGESSLLQSSHNANSFVEGVRRDAQTKVAKTVGTGEAVLADQNGNEIGISEYLGNLAHSAAYGFVAQGIKAEATRLETQRNADGSISVNGTHLSGIYRGEGSGLVSTSALGLASDIHGRNTNDDFISNAAANALAGTNRQQVEGSNLVDRYGNKLEGKGKKITDTDSKIAFSINGKGSVPESPTNQIAPDTASADKTQKETTGETEGNEETTKTNVKTPHKEEITKTFTPAYSAESLRKSQALGNNLIAKDAQYGWGGSLRNTGDALDPDGCTDCSGYTQYDAKATRNLRIPRTADAQLRTGQKVEEDELQKGDYVYFNNGKRGLAATHTGIYIGEDPKSGKHLFREFNSTKSDVKVSALEDRQDYVGARRFSSQEDTKIQHQGLSRGRGGRFGGGNSQGQEVDSESSFTQQARGARKSWSGGGHTWLENTIANSNKALDEFEGSSAGVISNRELDSDIYKRNAQFKEESSAQSSRQAIGAQGGVEAALATSVLSAGISAAEQQSSLDSKIQSIAKASGKSPEEAAADSKSLISGLSSAGGEFAKQVTGAAAALAGALAGAQTSKSIATVEKAGGTDSYINKSEFQGKLAGQELNISANLGEQDRLLKNAENISRQKTAEAIGGGSADYQDKEGNVISQEQFFDGFKGQGAKKLISSSIEATEDARYTEEDTDGTISLDKKISKGVARGAISKLVSTEALADVFGVDGQKVDDEEFGDTQRVQSLEKGSTGVIHGQNLETNFGKDLLQKSKITGNTFLEEINPQSSISDGELNKANSEREEKKEKIDSDVEKKKEEIAFEKGEAKAILLPKVNAALVQSGSFNKEEANEASKAVATYIDETTAKGNTPTKEGIEKAIGKKGEIVTDKLEKSGFDFSGWGLIGGGSTEPEIESSRSSGIERRAKSELSKILDAKDSENEKLDLSPKEKIQRKNAIASIRETTNDDLGAVLKHSELKDAGFGDNEIKEFANVFGNASSIKKDVLSDKYVQGLEGELENKEGEQKTLSTPLTKAELSKSKQELRTVENTANDAVQELFGRNGEAPDKKLVKQSNQVIDGILEDTEKSGGFTPEVQARAVKALTKDKLVGEEKANEVVAEISSSLQGDNERAEKVFATQANTKSRNDFKEGKIDLPQFEEELKANEQIASLIGKGEKIGSNALVENYGTERAKGFDEVVSYSLGNEKGAPATSTQQTVAQNKEDNAPAAEAASSKTEEPKRKTAQQASNNETQQEQTEETRANGTKVASALKQESESQNYTPEEQTKLRALSARQHSGETITQEDVAKELGASTASKVASSLQSQNVEIEANKPQAKDPREQNKSFAELTTAQDSKKLQEFVGGGEAIINNVGTQGNLYAQNALYGEQSKALATDAKIDVQGGVDRAVGLDVAESGIKAIGQAESTQAQIKEYGQAAGNSDNVAANIISALSDGGSVAAQLISSGIIGAAGALAGAQSGAKTGSDLASFGEYKDTESFIKASEREAIDKTTKTRIASELAESPEKLNKIVAEERKQFANAGKEDAYLEEGKRYGFLNEDGSAKSGEAWVRGRAALDSSGANKNEQGFIAGSRINTSFNSLTGEAITNVDGVRNISAGTHTVANVGDAGNITGAKAKEVAEHLLNPTKIVSSAAGLGGNKIQPGTKTNENSEEPPANVTNEQESNGDDSNNGLPSNTILGVVAGGVVGTYLSLKEKKIEHDNSNNGKFIANKDFSYPTGDFDKNGDEILKKYKTGEDVKARPGSAVRAFIDANPGLASVDTGNLSKSINAIGKSGKELFGSVFSPSFNENRDSKNNESNEPTNNNGNKSVDTKIHNETPQNISNPANDTQATGDNTTAKNITLNPLNETFAAQVSDEGTSPKGDKTPTTTGNIIPNPTGDSKGQKESPSNDEKNSKQHTGNNVAPELVSNPNIKQETPPSENNDKVNENTLSEANSNEKPNASQVDEPKSNNLTPEANEKLSNIASKPNSVLGRSAFNEKAQAKQLETREQLADAVATGDEAKIEKLSEQDGALTKLIKNINSEQPVKSSLVKESGIKNTHTEPSLDGKHYNETVNFDSIGETERIKQTAAIERNPENKIPTIESEVASSVQPESSNNTNTNSDSAPKNHSRLGRVLSFIGLGALGASSADAAGFTSSSEILPIANTQHVAKPISQNADIETKELSDADAVGFALQTGFNGLNAVQAGLEIKDGASKNVGDLAKASSYIDGAKDVAKGAIDVSDFKGVGSTFAEKGIVAGTKTAGAALGKSALKKLPGVGVVAGAAFAVDRAEGGDYFGAALEFASGAVSLIPGVGTAASVAIDGVLLERDYEKATEAQPNEAVSAGGAEVTATQKSGTSNAGVKQSSVAQPAQQQGASAVQATNNNPSNEQASKTQQNENAQQPNAQEGTAQQPLETGTGIPLSNQNTVAQNAQPKAENASQVNQAQANNTTPSNVQKPNSQNNDSTNLNQEQSNIDNGLEKTTTEKSSNVKTSNAQQTEAQNTTRQTSGQKENSGDATTTVKKGEAVKEVTERDVIQETKERVVDGGTQRSNIGGTQLSEQATSKTESPVSKISSLNDSLQKISDVDAGASFLSTVTPQNNIQSVLSAANAGTLTREQLTQSGVPKDIADNVPVDETGAVSLSQAGSLYKEGTAQLSGILKASENPSIKYGKGLDNSVVSGNISTTTASSIAEPFVLDNITAPQSTNDQNKAAPVAVAQVAQNNIANKPGENVSAPQFINNDIPTSASASLGTPVAGNAQSLTNAVNNIPQQNTTEQTTTQFSNNSTAQPQVIRETVVESSAGGSVSANNVAPDLARPVSSPEQIGFNSQSIADLVKGTAISAPIQTSAGELNVGNRDGYVTLGQGANAIQTPIPSQYIQNANPETIDRFATTLSNSSLSNDAIAQLKGETNYGSAGIPSQTELLYELSSNNKKTSLDSKINSGDQVSLLEDLVDSIEKMQVNFTPPAEKKVI